MLRQVRSRIDLVGMSLLVHSDDRSRLNMVWSRTAGPVALMVDTLYDFFYYSPFVGDEFRICFCFDARVFMASGVVADFYS